MSILNYHPLIWAWAAFLLVCSSTAEASTSFDGLPQLSQHAQQLTNSHLLEALNLYITICIQYNQRRESPALQNYVAQLQAVMQPDCCDYFTALPAVKGLAESLSEVLELRLPASLRPVVRRSYLAAVWLLQRSKYFKWASSSLHKTTLSGMYKLFDEHMGAVAGRPISFHHISKTGGTSLCSLAWETGCRGPIMSKKDNCLLDPGLDGPVWVIRHNVTTANNLTAVPPPPSEAGAASAEQLQQLQMADPSHKLLRGRNYDWFMYDCPAERMAGKVGRACAELQEGALGRSATFFANENALPTAHGQPQVCEAFTNVVILREAVGEAVSLMAEVSLVYTRLLKQNRVTGWAPPMWDLTWWQTWAPAVVNSYATRTLLGAAAFCPAAQPAAAPAASVATHQTTSGLSSSATPGSGDVDSSSTSSSSASGAGGHALPLLGQDDVQKALQALASFDVVLDLNSRDLMDASLAKLLGWSGHTYSGAQQQRVSQVLYIPTWKELDLLARQQAPKPPPPPPNKNVIVRVPIKKASKEQQDLSPSAQDTPEMDIVRRLIAQVCVRGVYARSGMPNVLIPYTPEVPLAAPPAAVVAAAVAALQGVRQGSLTAQPAPEGTGGARLLVRLQLHPPGNVSKAASAASGATVSPAAAEAEHAEGASYHVWPRHGVVLPLDQYQVLLQATAADVLLHQQGRTMQLLDAAWVFLLGEQRKVRKMLLAVQGEGQSACGFAGLNHLQ